jgi:hypothetical protein
VWGALRSLAAERIGHGIHCLEDDTLVEYLRAPNPSTVLVLTSTGLDGRSRLVTAAKKSGARTTTGRKSTGLGLTFAQEVPPAPATSRAEKPTSRTCSRN